MGTRKFRGVSPLASVLFGLLALALATGVGYATGLWDTPPTREEIEKSARERGIDGPIYTTGPVDDHYLVPERHGPYLFVPLGWQGDLEPLHPIPEANTPQRHSSDQAEVTSSPLWRTPELPADVRLGRAWSEGLPLDVRGQYVDSKGNAAFNVTIYRPLTRPIRVHVWTDNGTRLFEYTAIDGRPGLIWRSPSNGAGEIGVRVFDEASGTEYGVQINNTARFTQADALALVRSILP